MRSILLLFLFLFISYSSSDNVLSDEETDAEVNHLLFEEFGHFDAHDHPDLYLSSPVISHKFIKILLRIHHGEANLKACINEIIERVGSYVKFNVLQVTIALGRRLIRSEPLLKLIISDVCSLIRRREESKASDQLLPSVCHGVADLYSPAAFFIFTHTNVSSRDMTAVLLGPQQLGKERFEKSILNWKIPLPEKISSREFKKSTPPSKDVSKFLHLTDVHLDFKYTNGEQVSCPLPLCCRRNQGNLMERKRQLSQEVKGAQKWGEISGDCDAPFSLGKSVLQGVNQTLSYSNNEISYVLWSGDITPHDVWATTKQEILQTALSWTSLLKSSLPKEKPVFPILGNHEAFPVNMFSPADSFIPERISSKWIYREFHDNIWKEWFQEIDKENPEKTFKETGSYSVDLKQDKLKLIFLNTVYCSRKNLWNLFNPVDLGGQLSFLVKELTEAESNNQGAHIIGHLPPNNECIESWLSNYISIIDRFSDTIEGTFFGHTHLDQLYLYQSNGNSRCTAFLGGSITTFGHVNPCFKIYSMSDKVISM